MAKSSIYKQFSQKLIFATSLFVIILSFIFYGFTRSTIYQDIYDEMIKDAQLIVTATQSTFKKKEHLKVLVNNDTKIELLTLDTPPKVNHTKFKKDDEHFMQIIYPADKSQGKYIRLTKNITASHRMLNKIFGNLLFLGVGG